MPGLQNVYNLTASQIAMGEYQGYNFGSLSGNEYSSFYFISSSCFFFLWGGGLRVLCIRVYKIRVLYFQKRWSALIVILCHYT